MRKARQGIALLDKKDKERVSALHQDNGGKESGGKDFRKISNEGIDFMERNIEVKKAFSEFSREYDKFMQDTGHTYAKIKILENIKNEIRGSVLDVATGTGDIAIWMAKNAITQKIDGVDFSEKMVEKAKEKSRKERLNINFYVQDAKSLQYPDKNFDTVICCLGVCWFSNREKVLSEMKRVCKDDGKIILLEENGATLSIEKIIKEGNPKSAKLKIFEELEDYIPIEEIERVMSKLNFKLLKKTQMEPVDENHGLMGLIFFRSSDSSHTPFS